MWRAEVFILYKPVDKAQKPVPTSGRKRRLGVDQYIHTMGQKLTSWLIVSYKHKKW